MRRFHVLEMQRFESDSDEFLQFLGSLEKHLALESLPLSDPETGLPTLLYNFSDGLPGVLISLMKFALRKVVTDEPNGQIDVNRFVTALGKSRRSF